MTELWTSAEAASFLGVASADIAGRTLRRAGIQPLARQPGRSGQNLWGADEVRRFKASRPGRGRWAASRQRGTPAE